MCTKELDTIISFRNPGRENPGSSHLHDVSLSVVASMRVSIRMSLKMFARELVSGSLGISPHGRTMQLEGTWARLYQRCLNHVN